MQSTEPKTHCDALVVHCMDYRLQKFLQPWISGRFGFDNFDIISVAGSVQDYELVLKYVKLAVDLHGVQTVCLINHEDCGAYGPEGTYKRHQRDLRSTKERILALFPDLKVETFYLHLNGIFEPIE